MTDPTPSVSAGSPAADPAVPSAASVPPLLQDLQSAGQAVMASGARLRTAIAAHDAATGELADARTAHQAAQLNLENARTNLIAQAAT